MLSKIALSQRDNTLSAAAFGHIAMQQHKQIEMHIFCKVLI